MNEYSLVDETSNIFHNVLLKDEKLNLPASFLEAAKRVNFTGKDDKPFILMPMKITESSASLHALVATAANVATAERYGVDYQKVEIDLDLATLYLQSVLLVKVGGQSFMEHDGMKQQLARLDLHKMSTNMRRYASVLYKTRDGRYYHLHGSMDARATMKMVGVTDQEASREEAIDIYAKRVATMDSWDLERTANNVYKQAGAVAYTPEEFFASEQGKIMSQEPLWTKTRLPSPRKPWPAAKDKDQLKPLAGVKVIDFSRVIAAPAVSKVLALFGADVLRISSDELPEYPATMPDLQTGKRDANLNLKTTEGKESFAALVKDADILVDGYRPGALGRLGFDSQALRRLNPSLIYLRENCYGFKGPLAHRSGWQQISDCLVGLARLEGDFLGVEEAVVPLLRKSYSSKIIPFTTCN